jgi:hypothetical protein
LMPNAWKALLSIAAVTQYAAALEGIRNFRAVSTSLPGVYRSAALERATASDAARLLDDFRIRLIIDLRNDDEIAKAQAKGTEIGNALISCYDKNSPVGPGCVASEGAGELRRVHVPLLGNVDGFFDEVEARMSMARRAQALALRAVDARAYDQFLYDEVARGKQQLLYTAMLRSAESAQWKLALELAADRSRGGVLIHCAQGKDRTGVLAALLQHAAGDSEQEIVESYAASAALLEAGDADNAREGGDDAGVDEKSAPPPGCVDWSALRGSPPEAMAGTLEWVRREYGAIDNFLVSVGCDDRWRETLMRGSVPF